MLLVRENRSVGGTATAMRSPDVNTDFVRQKKVTVLITRRDALVFALLSAIRVKMERVPSYLR